MKLFKTTRQPAAGTVEGQAKPPPPDGARSTCRRCSNDIQYSGGRERWEHIGRGHAECFRPGGHEDEMPGVFIA